MTRNALLKKLDAIMADAERSRMWGQLEIEIRDGEATLLRKSTTEKLSMENTRDDYSSRSR
jgi:hypothetical protein